MNQSVNWSTDKLSEWFPALSERKNYTTVQGTEWLPNSEFVKNKLINDDFRDCVYQGEPCLASWAEKYHLVYSYLFLSKAYCPKNSANCLNYFDLSIRSSKKYQNIFENDGVVIFKKN